MSENTIAGVVDKNFLSFGVVEQTEDRGSFDLCLIQFHNSNSYTHFTKVILKDRKKSSM